MFGELSIDRAFASVSKRWTAISSASAEACKNLIATFRGSSLRSAAFHTSPNPPSPRQLSRRKRPSMMVPREIVPGLSMTLLSHEGAAVFWGFGYDFSPTPVRSLIGSQQRLELLPMLRHLHVEQLVDDDLLAEVGRLSQEAGIGRNFWLFTWHPSLRRLRVQRDGVARVPLRGSRHRAVL